MRRRTFLGNVLTALGLCPFAARDAFAKKTGEFKTAFKAFSTAGFDPLSKDNAYFAVVGDPHFNADSGENTALFKKIADELKSMNPQPAFCLLAGDLISNGNACFASVSKNHKKAFAEIGILRECIDYLKPVEAQLVLGNHDTAAPGDFENVIFKKAMPGLKPYRSFWLGKLFCIVLNGGHTALLGEEQREWLKSELSSAGKSETAIFIHQPMGNIATEYEASRDLREILDARDAETKIICGHIHINRLTVLETPNGKKIPQLAAEAPRHNRAPVYWLFCVSDGKIKNAVFRNKGGSFEVFDFNLPPEKWKVPFEGINAKAAFNPLSKDYCEISVKGWFNAAKCIYFYFYLKEIEFKLDLRSIEEYSQVVLLASNIFGNRADSKFEVSSDGKQWSNLKPLNVDKNYITLDLPIAVRNSKELFVKFSSGNVNASFGGVAVK